MTDFLTEHHAAAHSTDVANVVLSRGVRSKFMAAPLVVSTVTVTLTVIAMLLAAALLFEYILGLIASSESVTTETIVITCANEVMLYPGVSLFVYLVATSRKNYVVF